MLKKFVLRMATALAAIAIVAGSGLTAGQAATKTITLIDSFDIKDWDPAVIYSSEVRTLLNVYETLTHYNAETGKADPLLATDWSVSDDGLTWTFNLRHGVMFHDGTPFNAAAAKSTLDRTIEINGGAAYIWSSVESISAPSGYTLVINTKYPMPLDLVATSQYGAYMLSPTAAAKGTEWLLEGNAAGTGPHYVRQWDKGQQLVMEKFDDYWGGKPPLKSVEFRAVSEYSARIAGVVSGDFQMMTGIPVDEVKTVQGYDNLNYLSKPIGNYVMVAYNTLELPNFPANPVANVKLRYAMTAAIDREALTKALWGDETFAPAPFNFPDFPDYYDAKISSKISYDPAAAKAYLEESGYDGTEFLVNITRGAFPNFDLAMEFIVEQWNTMGINAKLNVVDSWAQALQHPFGLLNMSMTTTFDGTPTRAIWGFWGPDSARTTREKDRSWSPPAEFVTIGKKYLIEIDTAKKAELFRQMVDIWETEQPALILWRSVANWAVSDTLEWKPIASPWMLLGPGYASVK